MYYDKKMILLFGFCLWFFWVYDFIVRSLSDTYEKILLKKENQYYESQLKNMEQTAVTWKKLRHDLKNHFIVLKGMLDSGEEEKAKAYLDDFIQNEFGNKQEVQSGNTAIDSILNYKMMEAEQYSVVFDLDVQIPEQMAVSSQVMSVILGNALDNAIEACDRVSEKERLVKIFMKVERKNLFIEIKNRYDGTIFEAQDGRLISRKENPQEHGMGLRIMHELLEHADGNVETMWDEQVFTLRVMIYHVI